MFSPLKAKGGQSMVNRDEVPPARCDLGRGALPERHFSAMKTARTGTSCGQVGRLCSPDCAEDCDLVFEGDECAFAYFHECGYRSRTLRLFCD